ncbi:uncharacterized protein N0V89_002040 [Didymosphaeria variabile]|uniref:Uncharacterized protein n=1 Tax=Didymosphaeria variabile TaxID=1932322 RepID=A0A9W8XTP9_9PLEO|nr:uncharacterized protein N0V89_002040 [Didymosphaeria variabile]KAJ4357465.1 hypothetical protein N0V89_002040 [Didymosphaeria variabile]
MGKYDKLLAPSEWDGSYHDSEATIVGLDGRRNKGSAPRKRTERNHQLLEGIKKRARYAVTRPFPSRSQLIQGRSNRILAGHHTGAEEDEPDEDEDEPEKDEDGMDGIIAGVEMEETPQSDFSGPRLGQQIQDHANEALRRQASVDIVEQDGWVGDNGSDFNAASTAPDGQMNQSCESGSSRGQNSVDQGSMDWLASALDDKPLSQVRRAPPSEPPGFSEAGAQGLVRGWLEAAGRDREAGAVAVDEDEDDTPRLPVGRPRYDKAIEHGYIVAVKLAWQQALKDIPSVADQLTEPYWLWYGHSVLLSMQKDVLKAVASGNLAALYWGRDNDTVRAMFQDDSSWMKQGNVLAPVVYILCLTNKEEGGRAHTPDELRLVIDDLRRYGDIAESMHTLEVDNAYQRVSDMTDIRAGKPLFFCKNGNNGRKRTRYKPEDIKSFCDALDVRLGRLSADEMDGPLRRPLQYVGRAQKFIDRQEQHTRGDRSNWLMQLVKHVCNVRCPGQFTLDAFPVCYQVNDDEVACAEMLLALIANSWVTTGGGFNRAAPGLLGSGVYHEDQSVVDSWWAEQEDFRDLMAFWAANEPAEAAFTEKAIAMNRRGEKYPSAESISTQDQELATVTEGLARDRAEIERLERDMANEIARVKKELQEELGAE